MLKNKFKTLCQKFSNDDLLINKLWEEIKLAHTAAERYYHTLGHLEHIYYELDKKELTIISEFAIFYHDVIYDVKRSDNEEQSALLVKKRLTQLGVEVSVQEKVFELIIETATHKASSEHNALFLDADLAILGSSQAKYRQYSQNVRKEFTLYDDEVYNAGRKKVLKAFLAKERLYETSHFYDKYEKQARENILKEYNSLI